MALKKQTAIRTGKMVRELMLGDKVVNASTVMVYSNNDLNEEIKIEKITLSSNEEIFSNEAIDWNKSVIYKIVDFKGNVEVGKVVLQDIKKSHVTLKIERIMWKKEQNQEKVMMDLDLSQQVDSQVAEDDNHTSPSKKIEKIKAVQEEKVKEEKVKVQEEKVEKPQEEKHIEKVTQIPTHSSNVNYQRLLHIAMTICSNWDLGCDLDDSIDALKAELKQQGISSYFDEDTRKAIEAIRTLKEKGINMESLLHLL